MKSFKIITILSWLLLSHLVNAHSRLKNSVPANNAMLNTLPENITLAFSMPVKLVKLQLIEASKEPIKLITKPSKKFDVEFSLALPILESGHYKVKWVVMGQDTHKMKGDFTFMLNAPDRVKTPVNSSESHD